MVIISQEGSLGSSIGEGLNQLINNKVESLKKKQGIEDRKATYAKANLPDWLAELPEDVQRDFFKNWEPIPQEQKQQLIEAIENIGLEDLQQHPEQPEQQMMQQPVTPMGQEQVPYAQEPKEDVSKTENKIPGLNSLLEAGSSNKAQEGPSAAAQIQSQPALGHGTKGGAPAESLLSPSSVDLPKATQPRISQPRKEIEKSTQPTFARKDTLLAERKAQAAEKTKELKEQQTAHKETYPYYKQILDEEKAAKELDRDTDRMLKLIDKGNLPYSSFYKILKNTEENITPAIGAAAGGTIGGAIGLAGGPLSLVTSPAAAATGAAIGGAIGAIVQPITTLLRYAQKSLSPDTEEFEKLSSSMIRGAKAIFGSRITDQDLRAFMDTIPNLSQTDAGKKAIIRNMQLANQAVETKAKHMRQIIKENNGRRPADLQEQVDERSSRELDKLSKDFVG